jgi:hypothetical protein
MTVVTGPANSLALPHCEVVDSADEMARMLARHFMADRDGMRVIGTAVAALAEDPSLSAGFDGGVSPPSRRCVSRCAGNCG